jgi:hypothetical protein
MDFDELTGYFGGTSKSARALGVSKQTVDGWKRLRIPSKHQLNAAFLSGGRLRVDAKSKADAKEFARYLVVPAKAKAVAA